MIWPLARRLIGERESHENRTRVDQQVALRQKRAVESKDWARGRLHRTFVVSEWNLNIVSSIDEMAVYPYALAASQIKNHYRVGSSPSASLYNSTTAGPTYVGYNTNDFMISGGVPSFGGSINAVIDEVAMYSYALSAAQILDHFRTATST